MSSKLVHYAISGSSVVLAKSIAFSSTLVVAYLLNKFLGKEQYATYEFLMSIIYIVANVSLLGMDRVVLYRVSRLRTDLDGPVGSEIVNYILRFVAILSTSLGFAFCIIIVLFVRDVSFPNFILWGLILSAIIPIFSLNQVCAAWFQARQRLAEAILIPATADVCRMIFLVFVLATSFNVAWAAVALVLAAIVPLIVWATRVLKENLRRPEKITNWELKYGAKMMLTVAAHRGIERIDILMMGMLTTAVFTANYAVAARLAILVTLGNVLIGPAFAPRMGRLLADKKHSEFAREYAQNRTAALAIAICSAAVFTVFGPFILGIFGEYRESQPVLLILSAAHVIMVGFGPNGRYLGMAGRAGWLLITTLLLLLATIGFNLILIPTLGAEGAALGTLLSFLIINVVISIIIWRLDRIPTLSWTALFVVNTASVILLATAFDIVDRSISGAGLCILLAALLFGERHLWMPIAKRLCARCFGLALE